MSKTQKKTIGILKWVFALGLLYILFRSGRLSLQDLQSFLSDPSAGFLALVVWGVATAVTFYRWGLLLKSQDIVLGFVRIFQLGMLGQFFSTVIPGTVGGDVIKAIYIARRFPSHRVRVVSTIVMDRLMGLAAVIVLSAIAYWMGLQRLSEMDPAQVLVVHVMGKLLCFLALGLLIGLLLLPLLGRRLPRKLPEAFVEKAFFGKTLASIYEAGIAYQARSIVLWQSLLISCVTQLTNVSVLYIVAKTMFGPFPWGQIDAPLFILGSLVGLAAMSLPIAPLGLGVGQVAFAEIFKVLGASSATFGSSVVTGFQAVALIFSLTGAFFFAIYRDEVEIAQS